MSPGPGAVRRRSLPVTRADASSAVAGPVCRPLSGCITCSDEGVPMRVSEVRADDLLAVCVDGSGTPSEVMTDLVGRVRAGDLLLVHAGTALLMLDPAEARPGTAGDGGEAP